MVPKSPTSSRMGKCYQGNRTVLRQLEIAVIPWSQWERSWVFRREKLDIQFSHQWANDSNSCVYTKKKPQKPIKSAPIRLCLWGHFQRTLDYKGYDLTVGVAHWWILDLNTLLGGGEIAAGGSGWRTRSQRADPWRQGPPLSTSCPPWSVLRCPTLPARCTKISATRNETNLSSLALFLSSISPPGTTHLIYFWFDNGPKPNYWVRVSSQMLFS